MTFGTITLENRLPVKRRRLLVAGTVDVGGVCRGTKRRIKIRSKIKIKIGSWRDFDIQRQTFRADRALHREQLGDFAGFAAQIDRRVDGAIGAGRQGPRLGRHGSLSAAARALQIGDDDRLSGCVCSVKNEPSCKLAGFGCEVFRVGVPGEEVGTRCNWRGRRLLSRSHHDA